MSAKQIPELDAAGLRKFALTTSLVLVLLFGAVVPWLLARSWPLWPWIIAAVLSAWGLLAPASLNPVYRTWMRFGLVMGAISSRVILTLVFFLFVLPMGLVLRVMGKDPMQRSLSASASSYRKLRDPFNPKTMEKPF